MEKAKRSLEIRRVKVGDEWLLASCRNQEEELQKGLKEESAQEAVQRRTLSGPACTEDRSGAEEAGTRERAEGGAGGAQVERRSGRSTTAPADDFEGCLLMTKLDVDVPFEARTALTG